MTSETLDLAHLREAADEADTEYDRCLRVYHETHFFWAKATDDLNQALDKAKSLRMTLRKLEETE